MGCLLPLHSAGCQRRVRSGSNVPPLNCHSQSPLSISCSPGKHKLAPCGRRPSAGSPVGTPHKGSLEGAVKTPRAQFPVGGAAPSPQHPPPCDSTRSGPKDSFCWHPLAALVGGLVDTFHSVSFTHRKLTSLPTKQHECRLFP